MAIHQGHTPQFYWCNLCAPMPHTGSTGSCPWLCVHHRRDSPLHRGHHWDRCVPSRGWYHHRPLEYDDVIKWNHSPRYWPFVWGIHRPPVNSPHKGQGRGALMFFKCYLNYEVFVGFIIFHARCNFIRWKTGAVYLSRHREIAIRRHRHSFFFRFKPHVGVHKTHLGVRKSYIGYK